MHTEMFPAVTERYKDQVRVVYLDFPLDQHPWALHAAVDANCLVPMTVAGYWNYVDLVHAHAAEIGGNEQDAAKAYPMLDKLAEEEGTRQKVNAAELEACVKKQDGAIVKASAKQGESLGIGATPTIFVNGEKLDGVTELNVLYQVIDRALVAEGLTPPPLPPASAVPPAAAPPVPAAAPAAK
jgi:protein-disulfide isomerase